MRRGFTLVELMVVLVIISLVTAVVLGSGALRSYQHREVSEAGRTLQGAMVGARDRAINTGRPAGIRLLPDPAFPVGRTANGQIYPYDILAYNRIIPIEPAPDYSEGRISVHADGAGGSSNYPAAIRTVNGAVGMPCLVLEQSVTDANGLPNSPTSWFWNVRVGDQIQVNNAGPWYTVVGPTTVGAAQGNSELFVNIGPPGSPLPTLAGGQPCEYLLLVNGRDDNNNGWIDEGFDGIDNDHDGLIDNATEWREFERWLGSLTTSAN
jgi:prepilin-type N-terminal cleavage/methylation domain-containing protein